MQETAKIQQLASILDDAAIPIHFVGSDGTILWANKAELDMLGYTPEEYIGKDITDFHAEQDVIEEILRRLGTSETLRDFPATLRCKDGSVRHVKISSNVFWEGDNFMYTRCFTRDVTEQKRAEETVMSLSSPILEIDHELILLPLVGRVNSRRAALITSELLQAVKSHRARAVVIDLTGAAQVDTEVSGMLIRLGKSCRMLGAQVVLSGISTKVAAAMVSLEIPLEEIITAGSLREGIAQAKRFTGSSRNERARTFPNAGGAD